MKQNRFEVEVNRLMIGIESWCEDNGVEFKISSTYSAYIGLQITRYEEFKRDIKSYLVKLVGISKKKYDKIVSILFANGRIYFLFKNKVYIR